MSLSQNDQPLFDIVNLFNTLNKEGVRYCHWKSNCRLNRSIRGLTDLDLLIDSSHGQQFRLILFQHNLKPINSPQALQYPAVEDYLGFDSETGRLFHLHVHYQLILGEQVVKNYRLPLEEAFLNNVQYYQQLVKIPVPELELVVLAIRALLKYRDRDAVKDILSIRSPGIPTEIRHEIEYLLGQADWARISYVLNNYVGFVSPEIILDLLKTVVKSPRAGFVFYRLRGRLRSELSTYQRNSRFQAFYRYWGFLIKQRLPFQKQGFPKKIPATGGHILAVVGADGAGKSTVIGELYKWLSWKLKTYRNYMGSQQPSSVTRLLELCSRIVSKVCRLWGGFAGENNVPGRSLLALQRFSRNLYHLSVGQDRYRRYIIAKRQAGQGAIVLCDRYPLEAIWRVMEGRPMDGPQIAVEAGLKMDWLTRWFSKMEQNTYRKIHPPDYIFILHVSPQVSLQRKPDHDPKMILAKSQALKQMEKGSLHVIDVDADIPIEGVLLNIKSELWRLL